MIAFTAEMVSKINYKGLWDTSTALESSNNDRKLSYLKDRWCQFDASMLFFVLISVILQTLEIFHIVDTYSPLHMLRAPRPLIMIRYKSYCETTLNRFCTKEGLDHLPDGFRGYIRKMCQPKESPQALGTI